MERINSDFGKTWRETKKKKKRTLYYGENNKNISVGNSEKEEMSTTAEKSCNCVKSYVFIHALKEFYKIGKHISAFRFWIISPICHYFYYL